MTEFEIKHGLSQDEPGPLEPVELAAAVPAARAAGWKLVPIESAPKDGTPLLLFARLVGVNIATNSPYAPTIHVGAYRTDLRIWTGSAYRNQLEIELEPTHWMPRPAFPDCGAPASPVSTVEQWDAQDADEPTRLPYVVERILAFAGKSQRFVTAPHLSAQQTIDLAGWIQDNCRPAPAAGDARDAHFDLLQDDMVVASASGPRAQALEEIQHFAAVYSEDGPVQIEEVIRIPLSAANAAQRQGDA